MLTALALAFSDRLAAEIGPVKLAEVVRRNSLPDYQASGACASHDFCDANMTMFEAWIATFATEPDTSDDAVLALWNDAWTLARSASFNLPS